MNHWLYASHVLRESRAAVPPVLLFTFASHVRKRRLSSSAPLDLDNLDNLLKPFATRPYLCKAGMWRHSDVPLASTSEAGLDAVLSSFEEPVAAEAARELRHLARFKAVPSNLV